MYLRGKVLKLEKGGIGGMWGGKERDQKGAAKGPGSCYKGKGTKKKDWGSDIGVRGEG